MYGQRVCVSLFNCERKEPFWPFASLKGPPIASGKIYSRTVGSRKSKKLVFSRALNHYVVPGCSSENTYVVYFESIILTHFCLLVHIF